eukprot:GAHX01000580.1.p1 GENE.GAHX01000580.1~~GAHX01000580.1.p1  ORF type:complete len:412 (-),score=76.77 GAHX01000580.1:183-1418(-)
MVRGNYGTPPDHKASPSPRKPTAVSLKDIAGTTKLETNDFNKLSVPFKLLRVIDELDFVSPTLTQSSLLPLVHDPSGVGRFAVRAKPGSGKSTSIALLTLMSLLRDKNASLKGKSFYLVIVTDKQKRLDMIRLLTQLSTFCPGLLVEPRDIESNTPSVLVKTISEAIYLLRNKVINPSSLQMVAVDDVDQVFKLAAPVHINGMFKYILDNRTSKAIKLLFIDTYFSNHTINCFREWETNIKTVNVTPTDLIKTNIRHLIKYCNFRNRKAVFLEVANLVENDPCAQTVVYCNEDKEIDALFQYLTAKGESCIALKPGMNKEMTRKKIKSFQIGRGSVLISKCLANVGIKCSNVKFIINLGKVGVDEYYFNTAVTGDKDKMRYVVNLIGKDSGSAGWQEDVEKEYNIKMKELQ